MTESRKPKVRSVETSAEARRVSAAAIDESAGAWTVKNHPDLVTREDVVQSVRETRAELDQEVQRRTALRSWNLGLGTKRITRGDAYDDTALPEDDGSNRS